MVKLGYIDYLNCLPVHFGLEQGLAPAELAVHRGVPTQVNDWFGKGEIDVTAASSIVYAQNPAKGIILPGACVASDGPVGSILLFSKGSPAALDGKRVALPDSSATSVAMLRILLRYYYRVNVEYLTVAPSLGDMLDVADAALLIGDDALIAAETSQPLDRCDLGDAWKQFTGQAFVYALWLVRTEFARKNQAEADLFAQAIVHSREYSFHHLDQLLEEAARRRPLPRPTLRWYFSLLQHRFGPRERRGLVTFYDWCVKCGLLAETPSLVVWGENHEETID